MTTLGYIFVFGYLSFITWLVYSGKKAGWPSSSQRVLTWGLVPGGFVLALVVGIFISNNYNSNEVAAKPGESGVDANVTRIELRDISTALVTADKKGDSQLASLVVASVLVLTLKIEGQPEFKKVGSGLYNCSLAARNLLNGAKSVGKGGRWLNQDQFQEAVSDCRS